MDSPLGAGAGGGPGEPGGGGVAGAAAGQLLAAGDALETCHEDVYGGLPLHTDFLSIPTPPFLPLLPRLPALLLLLALGSRSCMVE